MNFTIYIIYSNHIILYISPFATCLMGRWDNGTRDTYRMEIVNVLFSEAK